MLNVINNEDFNLCMDENIDWDERHLTVNVDTYSKKDHEMRRYNYYGPFIDKAFDKFDEMNEVLSGRTLDKDIVILDDMLASCNSYDITRFSPPNYITKIGHTAFAGCYRLEKIIMTESVTCIDENAFRGCIGLESVTIPDSVEKLGKGAFANCEHLTDVEISDELLQKTDVYDVFKGTPWLEENWPKRDRVREPEPIEIETDEDIFEENQGGRGR